MSNEAEIKRKLASMLGKGVLATALVVAPLSVDISNMTPEVSSAWASEGGSGGGSGGNGGGSGGGGNSGSGGGDDGNNGSGSTGESGNSGSGNSGESGNSGKGSSGESSKSGPSGENGRNRRNRDKSRGRNKTVSIPSRFGRVVNSLVRGRHIEVYYSDGWKEGVKGGNYRLKDPKNRTIVQRPARASDYARLSRITRK